MFPYASTFYCFVSQQTDMYKFEVIVLKAFEKMDLTKGLTNADANTD
jgi:hypothetical protein